MTLWVFFVIVLTAQGWAAEPHEFTGLAARQRCEAVRIAMDDLHHDGAGRGAGIVYLSPCLGFELPHDAPAE